MVQKLVRELINRNREQQEGLIALLERIQATCGYLPEEALRTVAAETDHPLAQVYGVATFYRAFSLRPRGRHLVSTCLGTACHVRNAHLVACEFERQLGVPAGETTRDAQFTLERVNCLGACALGPVVVVDGHYFSGVAVSGVAGILRGTIDGLDRIEIATDQRVFPVQVSCPRCNHSLMDASTPIDGFPSVRVTLSYGRQHCGLRLSSVYGSYNVECKVEVPKDEVVTFFCPRCSAQLIGAVPCSECGVRMVPLFLRGGGTVQFCPRRGCKGHRLDVESSIELEEGSS